MAVDSRSREYRAALVFFGGVSLAIYENGVARAFYDAVRKRGVFEPLMALLDADFAVDVISGSSAGGINGLMLATALESGVEFKSTAALWREAGGIDELLRDSDPSARAPSLFKGETYYVGELRKAFRGLCRAEEDDAAPKEMDVFVTGTDLTGQLDEFTDAADSTVETMSHSLVFHLKHRKRRARLGIDALGPESLGQVKAVEKPSLQSDILASVARITSSFPAAFPPFTTQELDNNKMESTAEKTPDLVRKALERLSGAHLGKPDSEHALVDGGVLDNKPFKPVLDAVFHRMPSERCETVDRKLFYVEPDPERFKTQTEFTPLQVILNSVVSLPLYDSIASDVRRLEEHNNRIRRFKAMRKSARAARASEKGQECDTAGIDFAYRSALRQSIGCMLLGVNPTEVNAAQGLDDILPILEKSRILKKEKGPLGAAGKQDQAGSPHEPEQRIDLSFHLRRAYDLLYDESPDKRGDLAARHAIGRVIKALKLLRDVWLSEVVAFQRQNPDHSLSRESTKARKLAFRRTATSLSGDAPKPELKLIRETEERLQLLQKYLDAKWLKRDALEVLDTGLLSEMREQAAEWLHEELRKPSGAGTYKTPRSLAWLEEALKRAVADTAKAERLEAFGDIDACVYPAELAAGLYELDEVEIARIAPKDAKPPEDVEGPEKITGDTLAHFSAFLRRDWRTNDIAWGHSDALCQIIKVLLSPAAWNEVSARIKDAEERERLKPLFTRRALLEVLSRDLAVDEKTRQGMEATCGQVEAELEKLCQSPDDPEIQESFKRALITAAQVGAMSEYTEAIVADAKKQNEEWRWKEGRKRRLEPGVNALEQMKSLKLGSKSIKDEMPGSLVVEYLSQIGLLVLGMLGASIKSGSTGGKLFKRVENAISPLLKMGRTIGRTLRTERALATAFLLALFVGLFGFGLGGVVSSSGLTAAIGFGLAFLLAVAITVLRHPLGWMGLTVLAAGALYLWVTSDLKPILTKIGEILIKVGTWLGE